MSEYVVCPIPSIYPYPSVAGGAPSGASSDPLLELQTSPTDFARLIELSFTLSPNSANNFGLVLGVGIPAAKGVGINGASLLVEDRGNTSVLPAVTAYTWWNQAPTIPTKFIRRLTFALASSNTQVWTDRLYFPRGITIPPATSLVVWLIAGAGLGNVSLGVDINAVIDA